MFQECSHVLYKTRRNRVQSESEKVFDLGAENQDGNTAGKPHRDGIGNVFDHRAQSRDSHGQQKSAGENGADHQVIETVLLADTQENDDERPGGATD